MESLISVIIPIYNMEKYIGESLSALESQTYKYFEVIIVDDGSTDNGSTIIQQYIGRNILKIDYVYQENKGVSAARNVGINNCKTEYIFFCDADDLLPRNTLETVLLYATKYDVVAGLATRDIEKLEYIENDHDRTEGISFLMNKYFFENRKLQFCSFLYKTNLLNYYEIRFSTDLKYGEDEEFTWKYLCYCKSAVYINIPLYFYRENPSSASNNVVYKRVQVIDSIMRVSNYYRNSNNLFYLVLEKYGKERAKLAILREFSIAERRDLYNQLVASSVYKMKMTKLLLFPSFKIKLAALLFLTSSSLFYQVFRKFKI